jgi:hypothetical protein
VEIISWAALGTIILRPQTSRQHDYRCCGQHEQGIVNQSAGAGQNDLFLIGLLIAFVIIIDDFCIAVAFEINHINNQPRKCLACRTPGEVLMAHLQEDS